MNRDILRIITFGSALTWGGIMASLQALTPAPAGFSFHVSWLTVAAFIGGTAAVYFFWRLIAEALLILSGVAAFLYPLRFVPKSKLPEISIGLAFAVAALSIVAAL